MSAAIIKTIRAQLGALHAAGYEGIVASSVGDLDVLIAEIDHLTGELELARLTVRSMVRAMQDDDAAEDEREALNDVVEMALEEWCGDASGAQAIVRGILNSDVWRSRRQGPITDERTSGPCRCEGCRPSAEQRAALEAARDAS